MSFRPLLNGATTTDTARGPASSALAQSGLQLVTARQRLVAAPFGKNTCRQGPGEHGYQARPTPTEDGYHNAALGPDKAWTVLAKAGLVDGTGRAFEGHLQLSNVDGRF